LREYYRDKRNEKVQFDENFEIEDENFVTEASVESEDIKVIIENLKEKQKNILNLMYFKEMSVRQVASELKISESDVKVTAHRAYKIIREKILKKNGKN
jgi:RNA polymerase sigma-70 factor (ECF subfamily)